MALKRFVNGAPGDFFFQKRAPDNRPDWIETVELSFPSGRTADEIVVRDAAQLAWIVNLGCIDLNPHPVRAEDLDHPDELRVDLDPVPGVAWADIRQVALVAREALADVGLIGWPKTSGSRGIHINVRIEPRWTFPEVRRAALALARDVERAPLGWRPPSGGRRSATASSWTTTRTPRTAPSHPPTRCGRPPTRACRCRCGGRRCPTWSPRTSPWPRCRHRSRQRGDRDAGIDAAVGSLDALLELSARHEAEGQGDAPWPPHYAKQAGEPPRVQPSKRKSRDTPSPTGRRTSTKPLIEIARAAEKDDALAGLERWKARHPDVADRLDPADVLVDGMRGRSTLWWRIRVNLEHVPEDERPPQEPLDPDYDPWAGYRERDG